MKTCVEIEGLRLHGRHGVMEQERLVGNEFQYSLKIEYPFHRGAESDCLDGTINYAEVVDIVRSVNDMPSRLLENVAFRLKNALIGRWPAITGGMIRVSKPAPPIPSAQLDRVSVVISW